MSAGALRLWENEYGLLTPKRSAGGTRLYSDSDIEQARSIHRLVHHLGYSLSSLSQAHDQLRFMRSPHRDVHAVLRRLVQSDSVWTAARVLVEGVTRLTNVASARLGLYRERNDSLSFIATSLTGGTFRDVCPPIAISRLPPSWQKALEKREPHSDRDLRQVPLPDEIRSRLEKDRTRSLYAEPLAIGQRLVGILAVGGARPGDLPAQVRDICERLAVPAGPAISYLAGQY